MKKVVYAIEDVVEIADYTGTSGPGYMGLSVPGYREKLIGYLLVDSFFKMNYREVRTSRWVRKVSIEEFYKLKKERKVIMV